MNEEELKNVLSDKIKEDFDKQFRLGMQAGWDACLASIKKNIANMSSAKTIKMFINEAVKQREVIKNNK